MRSIACLYLLRQVGRGITMDVQELSGVIEQLYDCALSGDWLDVLKLVRDKTHSNKVYFVVRDVIKDSVVDTHLIADFDYNPMVPSAYLNNFEHDPWFQHSLGALEGEITRPSVDVPVETFDALPIYQNYFVPLNTHYAIGGIIIRDEGYESFLICNRGREASEYADEDIKAIELLMPHFRQAVRIYLTLQSYKKVRTISQAINSATEASVILCKEDGTILEANEMAQEMLHNEEAFLVDGGYLALNKAHLNDRLKYYIKECAHFKDNRISLKRDIYVESENNRAFVVSVLPLSRVDASIHTQYTCVVKINSQKQVRWQSIQHSFELTPTELFVTELIFNKYTTMQIAEELNITVNTARSHIQNIYEKLNVKSQVELMSKLSLYAR